MNSGIILKTFIHGLVFQVNHLIDSHEMASLIFHENLERYYKMFHLL